MVLLVAFLAGLLVFAESSEQAEDSNLRGSDASRTPVDHYYKFLVPNRARPATDESHVVKAVPDMGGSSFTMVSDKPFHPTSQAQKLTISNTPITLSAIGVGLLSLVAMLGVRMWRGLQLSTVLASSGALETDTSMNMASVLGDNVTEMKSHNKPLETTAVATALRMPSRRATGMSVAATALRATGDGAESPPRSVAVFGATGLVGRECTHQLLERGFAVRALCRDPTNVLTPMGSTGKEELVDDEKLYKYKGSVTSAADVEKVFEAGDVEGVVIALGGKTKDVGPTMLTDGTNNIIEAMKKYGVKRIAVVTSIGAGDSKDQAPIVFKMLMMTVMSSIFTDKNNQEALFTDPAGAGRDLEWCIVRPGGLTVEKPTGVINVIEGKAGSIARADVADFCIGAVLEPEFPYIRKSPCISSVGGTSWVKDRSAAAREGMIA